MIGAVLALILAALSMVGLGATPARAAQHQNANQYVYWTFGSAGGFSDVDQRVQVTRKAPATFWAQYWTWTSGDGGYLGLQTDGVRFDSTRGDTAIFSLWGATHARSGPRASCDTFGGEGVGMSCRAAFAISEDSVYRYRVVRMEADATGQWWGAWIEDLATGDDVELGSLRVANDKIAMAPPMNFIEYFGEQASCDAVPMSSVTWAPPGANRLATGFQYGSSYSGTHLGSCTTGHVEVRPFGDTAAAYAVMGSALAPPSPTELVQQRIVGKVVKSTRASRRAPVRLPTSTTAAMPIRWVSHTPRICKVRRHRLVARGDRGRCRITATAGPVGNFRAFARTYVIRVR